jgi:hypothetical protein
MKNAKLKAAGAALLAFTALPACKMPPKQAWQQIQSEGLVSYFGADAKGRQISSEPGERFGWLDGFFGTPAGQVPRISFEEPQDAPKSFGIAARPVPGRPGLVYSPFATDELVDVSQFAPGEQVRCPHTGMLFFVPGASPNPAVIASVDENGRERISIDPLGEPKPEPIEIDPVPMPEPIASIDSAEEKPDGLTATGVPGRPNQVYSPYAAKHQIVDITGLKAGDKARCPYTDRIFVVPGASIAASQPPVSSRGDGGRMLASPRPAPKQGAKPERDPDPKPENSEKPEKPEAPEASEKPKLAGGESNPTASWSDKSGFVKSPFGGHLVDVRGKDAGAVVRCPFSGKQFKVPSGSN